MQQMLGGTPSVPDSLQDLRYDYDRNGNIWHIYDYKTGSPQTQTFSYDPLDRLTGAKAENGTGGAGNYDQSAASGLGYSYDPANGNLASKAGTLYTYGDMNHRHAVTALSNGNTYSYDSNGNMTQRVVGGQSYTLSYDAENHMTGVSGAAAAAFTYNGDGQRIVASEGVTTTVYLSNYAELAWNSQTQTLKTKKYYYAGTTRVAMRQGGAAPLLVLGDHLGSTSRVVNYDGSVIPADQLYAPWGETRFTNGSMPTQYQFTGQYRQAGIGLDYFNARWYDPALGRFSQPDTIVPDAGNVLDWDRYQFVRSNPIRYTDPSGHNVDCGLNDSYCSDLMREYYYSDWQKDFDFETFLNARDAYYYYYKHPEAAFQDTYVGEEKESVMWARIYSEDVVHSFFEPIPDFMFLDKIAAAQEANDVNTFLTLLSGLAISDWLQQNYGTNGNLVRGKFPDRSTDQYLYRVDSKGNIAHFAVYNEAGEIQFRVDLVGRADNKVPTPHIQYARWSTTPDGKRILNGWFPATPWPLP